MRDGKVGTRKKKLVWTIVALVLVVAIASAWVYVNVSNTLDSALRRSLSTFALASVAYAPVNGDAVDMNVSLSLENPTGYFVRVNSIALSFWVGGKYIGTLTVAPNQELPPGEKAFFHFVRPHLTDEVVLNTIHKTMYELDLDGTITASASHLFAQASLERKIDYTREVSGIS